MVEVSGMTIGELPQVDAMTDGFMFLGCQGTATSYSTWKTTYGALKQDLSAIFINSISADIDKRLSDLEMNILSGDGSLYFKKSADVMQTVWAEADFNNTVQFNGKVQFAKNCSEEYYVALPKDSFRNPSDNTSTDFSRNDASRIATGQDISAAIQNLQAQLDQPAEQILDMNYSPYNNGTIKLAPVLNNNNYQYDPSSSNSHAFYRYAGIRDSAPSTPDLTWAASSGKIYSQKSGFHGVPLTKSYKNFKTLTVVCLYDTTPTTDVSSARKIHSMTIPVLDIELARQYVQYKAQFTRTGQTTSYFDNVADIWYFGDAVDSMLYMSIKVQDTFNDTFLPLHFSKDGYSVIAVFGKK